MIRRRPTPLLSLALFCLVAFFDEAIAASYGRYAADHSGAASTLFNNMRIPAALIGASIVPLGLLSAPIVESTDNARAIRYKNANMMLAIVSLTATPADGGIREGTAPVCAGRPREVSAVPTR